VVSGEVVQPGVGEMQAMKDAETRYREGEGKETVPGNNKKSFGMLAMGKREMWAQSDVVVRDHGGDMPVLFGQVETCFLRWESIVGVPALGEEKQQRSACSSSCTMPVPDLDISSVHAPNDMPRTNPKVRFTSLTTKASDPARG